MGGTYFEENFTITVYPVVLKVHLANICNIVARYFKNHEILIIIIEH